MESVKWNREEIKKWASKFGRDRFEREIFDIVGAKKVQLLKVRNFWKQYARITGS